MVTKVMTNVKDINGQLFAFSELILYHTGRSGSSRELKIGSRPGSSRTVQPTYGDQSDDHCERY